MRVYILLFILCIPLVSAWNWQTHSKLAESAYYSLNMSFPLDVAALRNGSIAPDRDFHDNRLHHYPPSYNKTLYWLEETKKALEREEYSNASYAFGVASHYISDSFAAPHNIKGESSSLHAAYEKQADISYKLLDCVTIPEQYDLQKDLEEATKQGLTWEPWVDGREEKFPQEAAMEAYTLLLQVGKTTFESECGNQTTKIAQTTIPEFKPLTLFLISLTLYCIIQLSISIYTMS